MYIVNQLTLGSNQSPKVAANMERIDKGSSFMPCRKSVKIINASSNFQR